MSDLYAPLLLADDGHGAGGQSGASMTAAPVDWVEPKPEQPDAAADPRRDDSAVASNGRGDSAMAKSGSHKHKVEDADGAAGRGDSAMAVDKVEDPKGAAGRGVPGTAGDQSQSGGGEETESEEEKERSDAAGCRRDGGAGEESGRSIESSSSESIDSQHSHANGMLKDMEADLAGASTTAARMAIIKNISRRLAETAAGSSMASEALSFLRAVEHFNPRKDRKKKVVDTEVNPTQRAGLLLPRPLSPR